MRIVSKRCVVVALLAFVALHHSTANAGEVHSTPDWVIIQARNMKDWGNCREACLVGPIIQRLSKTKYMMSYPMSPSIGGGTVPVIINTRTTAFSSTGQARICIEPRYTITKYSTSSGFAREALVVEEEKKTSPQEKQRGVKYLAKMAATKGAVKTASGLVYIATDEGGGAVPQASDKVKVHYTGTLMDGSVFDTSRSRGPAEFALKAAIPCWAEGVQKMRVGGKAKFICPPELAYGARGNTGIPGDAVITFEVELLEIVPPPKAYGEISFFFGVCDRVGAPGCCRIYDGAKAVADSWRVYTLGTFYERDQLPSSIRREVGHHRFRVECRNREPFEIEVDVEADKEVEVRQDVTLRQ